MSQMQSRSTMRTGHGESSRVKDTKFWRFWENNWKMVLALILMLGVLVGLYAYIEIGVSAEGVGFIFKTLFAVMLMSILAVVYKKDERKRQYLPKRTKRQMVVLSLLAYIGLILFHFLAVTHCPKTVLKAVIVGAAIGGIGLIVSGVLTKCKAANNNKRYVAGSWLMWSGVWLAIIALAGVWDTFLR